jgi:hypothetical protein
MSEQNQQPLPSGQAGLETLQDIRRIMDRSSRFISLSGLSGVAAGVIALVGAYFAYDWLYEYYVRFETRGYANEDFRQLKMSLLVLAGAVLAAALVSAFYFTWRKAKRDNVPVWDRTSRRLAINMLVPLIAGGLFILAMLGNNEWHYVGPASLIFYGLALVNASKYTLTDVRYLGYFEILLGIVNTQYIGYSLYFWAVGFGVLHIIYGFAMWWKYERK